MLDRELVITIPGRPAPKGSMKCVGARGRLKHALVEDNKRSQPWRDTIALAVRRRWPAKQNAVKGQPLVAEATFTLPRPTYHYGTGRNATVLKPKHLDDLPVSHASGDVDKLLRLALDALQDTDVLPDDCAVVETIARKVYVHPEPRPGSDVLTYPGVVIRLCPVPYP